MPKIKPRRGAPTIDMTAMVDVAFLLLTFFILTTKFKAEERLPVDTPSSASGKVVPPEVAEKLFVITISNEGTVFIGHNNPEMRENILRQVLGRYGLPSPSEEGMKFFRNQPSFGVPINQIPQWLSLDPPQMSAFPQTSIPVDLRGGKLNELKEWIVAARVADPYTMFAIKGDAETMQPQIEGVIGSLQDAKVNKFSLITNIEADPAGPKADKAEPEKEK